jgi:hypothetical protein
MAKRDECPVLLVKDIDHRICNVVFECLVLNVYGNSSISFTSSKYVAFSCLHANVINNVGIITIILSIRGGLIKTHVMFTKKNIFYG